MKLYKAIRNDRCVECNFCKNYVCPSPDSCIGCGACYIACPNMAVDLVEREVERFIRINVDCETYHVPDNITVKKALEIIGYKFSKIPEKDAIFSPCDVGGCWSCAVEIDGELRPSCVTPVRDGMVIRTEFEYEPKRLVHGFSGHPVGGVGTPWWIKGIGYIEVACFACGCNLRCPQCQNWTTTYCGKINPLRPEETAGIMVNLKNRLGVERIAISGGECTLNREWLIRYVEEIRRLDPHARIHIDTNATILTPDYIDDLVEAGMTDIGIDIKALDTDTFERITGVGGNLACIYLENEWRSLKYVLDMYSDIVFVGVGIPYNKDLISLEEVRRIGERILDIDDCVQVCVLDYRPEFRRMDIKRPRYIEMVRVWRELKDIGLKNVICQTEYGHIDPNGNLI